MVTTCTHSRLCCRDTRVRWTDCIFIDPPYNTGNENWDYNDNVNSPIMREWLDGNPVNKEDMLRHDKWCCMMYPRLKLLHELLSETGSFWMTLDDNEVHRARMILDEVFGEENFVALVTWQKKVSPANDAKWFSSDHDFVIVYAQSKAKWRPNRIVRNEEQAAYYTNPDNDYRGDWNSSTYTCNKSKDERPNLYYPIIHPATGEEVWPKVTAVWQYSQEAYKRHAKDGLIYWGKDGTAKVPRIKKFLSAAGDIVPRTIWGYQEVGSTQEATTVLKNIFPRQTFISPKPVRLMKRIIELATDSRSLILDSFAGSGTTAHAVLAQNAKDGGNRKFILVECEDYADTLTAERVRRVINGYAFKGKQREELLREKITWTKFAKLKPHAKLLKQVQQIENLEGYRFDTIKPEIKNGELIVIGEKQITEKVAGLGGDFTFYTLGDPIDIDKILTGEQLPGYVNMGSLLFHTATGEPLQTDQVDESSWYLGESPQYHVWLVYKPDLDFLKSSDAALTLSLAEQISKSRTGKRHLVFAPAKYVPNKKLLPLGVEYAPLPFALYRVERG